MMMTSSTDKLVSHCPADSSVLCHITRARCAIVCAMQCRVPTFSHPEREGESELVSK